MRSKYSVKLKTVVEEHHLRPLHTSKDYETALLTTCSWPAFITISIRTVCR